MEEITAKVLVIGGGPAGYVAAIRAGQLGLKAVLVEGRRLGGTCLNVGCIPSKAIIDVAKAYHRARGQTISSPYGLTVGEPRLDFAQTLAWKDGIVGRLNTGVASLLKKAGVLVLEGHGALQDGKTCLVETSSGPVRVQAEHLVLATGSQSVELAALPFGGAVVSSTEALSLPQVPKRLVVVGAGYIGLELGMAFAKLGATVTIVEAAGRILPGWDAELTRPVARKLEALGMEVLTGAVAEGPSADGAGLRVRTADGAMLERAADKILVAVGRQPRTQGFGLERLDLTMGRAGIAIDERCATSMRGVWAIGDVTGEPMLAHRAMAQGEQVAEIIAGRRRVFDKVAIPAVCFTDPEIVAVGLSLEEAKAAGHEVKAGRFPFAANGRAMTQGDDAGFVRIVARAGDGLVLGLQAVGADVSELAAAFSLALEMGATLEDIAGTIHAHPTRGEAVQEAAMAALGHSLHS